MESGPVPEKLQKLAEGFDRFSPRYDRLFGGIMRPVWKTVAAACPVGSETRVLDLCTGTGGLLAEFAKAGANVTGVDISEGMLGLAAKKLSQLGVDHRTRLIRRSVAEIDFPKDSFDIVSVSLAIHEMPDPVRREVLTRMCAVSRRHVLIFDYFIPPSPVGRWFRILQAPWEWFETPYFINHYCRANLAAELESLGFSVEQRQMRGVFPGQGSLWIAEKKAYGRPGGLTA